MFKNFQMLKKMMYVAAVMTLLSAAVVSARQLATSPKSFPGACRGTCSATVHCSGTCFCNLDGPAAGFCTQDPIGVKPAGK
jgi:hypothetical protein